MTNTACAPREGEVRIPSGCAISGIFSRAGELFSGERVIRSIAAMHDRSNGLGGGFAGYGIYPQYAEFYAFHIFFDHQQAKTECEAFLESRFNIVNLSRIPVRKSAAITGEPMIWRYFVTPLPTRLADSCLTEEEYTVRCVFAINSGISGAYVFSSGKNMGVFNAVGYPEDVGDYYRLEEYRGYCWTAHGRYPTNTPGWWGGVILVRDDVGYRAGIHLKSYEDRAPVIVIGGGAGSFLGEYQAGGLILVLGIGRGGAVPVGRFCGTGMHGGRMLLRTDCLPFDLPEQVCARLLEAGELGEFLPYIRDYCRTFGRAPEEVLAGSYYLLTPNSSNPYRQLYA